MKKTVVSALASAICLATSAAEVAAPAAPTARLDHSAAVARETEQLQVLSVGSDNSLTQLNASIVDGDNFIVGGTLAVKGDFRNFVQGNGCGGTLIAPDIVLTAAHCRNAFSGRVLVSAMVYNSPDAGAEWRTIRSGMQVHPSFVGPGSGNDYMLFKIDPIYSVRPAPLNRNNNYPYNKQTLQVCGFGARQSGGYGTNRLRKVRVQTVSNRKCNRGYGQGRIKGQTMLCAGSPMTGGRDSCQGDSGGGLFDSNGKIVGIVSWGDGCGLASKPGVYARVSGAATWIENTACALGSKASWCRNRSASTVQGATSLASAVATPTAGTTQAVPASASATTVSALVTVQYDAYPEEFGWSLVDVATGAVKASYPANSFFQPQKLLNGRVTLERGHTYRLLASDVEGDGICCQNGQGFIEIIVDDTALVNRWGDIGAQWSEEFTVPL